jgi:hypothetical protein
MSANEQLPDETAAIDAANVRVFRDPTMDRLRLTVGDDRSYINVKPVWAAPLTYPKRYLVLLDGKGDEILLLPDPDVLDSASRSAIDRELRARYLTADVKQILHSRQEFGASYWTVETDRGRRDFVTQSLQENAQWLSDTHLLLIDVDGNRFEITDTDALDLESRRLLFSIV